MTVYHIGDYDDDGLQIGRDIERKLSRFMLEFTDEPPPFRFVRLAVNEGQIREFNLPSNPAKASRGKEVEYTVEAEAVPAWRMREWLKAALASHLDEDALTRASSGQLQFAVSSESKVGRFDLDVERAVNVVVG